MSVSLDKANIWDECLLKLKSVFSHEEFAAYIKPAKPKINQNKQLFYLLVPNAWIVEFLKDNHIKIENALISLYPDFSGWKIDFLIESIVDIEDEDASTHQESIIDTVDTSKKSNFKKDFNQKIELNKKFTFDNFVEGNSNAIAKASALSVSNFQKDQGPLTNNPLLLYGGVGLGKTHLMHAIANKVIDKNKEVKVHYVSSHIFVFQLIEYIRAKKMNEFFEKYFNVDLLLIDDIQFFAGKDKSQQELFHVFNFLIESGSQLVLSSDKYPTEINNLEDRLVSRCIWGLSVCVEPPDLETRVAIVLQKAKEENIEMNTDVALYIAENIKSNVRELEGSLRRVIAHARFSGKSLITKSLVQSALKDLIIINERKYTVDNIIKIVSEYYAIKVSDILSKKRTKNIVLARQMAMFLCKKYTTLSLPDIGNSFSGKDHTTVLHAYKKIEKEKEESSSISEDVTNLNRILSR